MLQGISKLDYFLKVSMFQIYKDKELNKERVSIDDRNQTVTYRDVHGNTKTSFQLMKEHETIIEGLI